MNDFMFGVLCGCAFAALMMFMVLGKPGPHMVEWCEELLEGGQTSHE